MDFPPKEFIADSKLRRVRVLGSKNISPIDLVFRESLGRDDLILSAT